MDPHAHHGRCTLIGDGVCLRATVHGPGELVTGEKFDEHPAGFLIAHRIQGDPDGEWCQGSINLDEAHFGPERWQQAGSLEGGDLTLKPSIACVTHPEFHAYVTNGRWSG